MILGYLVMGLIFLIVRFFYHILPKKESHDNLLTAVKKDFINLYKYVKHIILFHRAIAKIIAVCIPVLFVIPMLPYDTSIVYILDDGLAAIVFFLLVIVFAPQNDASRQGFPVEIFGFTYSVIFMFYSAGALVFNIFYINDFFKEDMWLYGYTVTIISYVVCIATLKGFMDRKLSMEEIVLLGMIMLTTLEFITYYGVGFFSGADKYDPADYENNLFGNITMVINQGLYIASQSQILERNSMEVWGNIILNGTDVLTITAVLGYVLQKFMDSMKS